MNSSAHSTSGVPFSLLAIGHPRSRWFAQVTQWAHAGLLSANLMKCVSIGEVRVQLHTAKSFSALLIEAGVAGVDRDLFALAQHMDTPTLVVDDDTSRHDAWRELGADDVTIPSDSPQVLRALLRTWAKASNATQQHPAQAGIAFTSNSNNLNNNKSTTAHVNTSATAPASHAASHTTPHAEGTLIAVCGSGGSGVSSISAALAQECAAALSGTSTVALLDFARNAEHAMLHNASMLTPNIVTLVDDIRRTHPNKEDVRDATLFVEQRGYRLLLGMPRSTNWTLLPPLSIRTALQGLLAVFPLAIADITSDFEDASLTGSHDVADRNGIAFESLRAASFVVVVSQPGMKGLHAQLRIIEELRDRDIDTSRIIPVVNFTPTRRFSRARAEYAKSFASCCQELSLSLAAAPLFLPEMKSGSIDNAFRDNARLPAQLVQPLLLTLQSLLVVVGPTSSAYEEFMKPISPSTPTYSHSTAGVS